MRSRTGWSWVSLAVCFACAHAEPALDPDGLQGRAPAPKASAPPAAVRECTVTAEQCKTDGCAGWVWVEFDITMQGSVLDPRVVKSCPPGLLDDQTLERVRTWTFPSTPTGEVGRRVVVRFQLDEQAEKGE